MNDRDLLPDPNVSTGRYELFLPHTVVITILHSGVLNILLSILIFSGHPLASRQHDGGTLVLQLYKSAIGNIYEEEEWGPLEFAIMAKHFERQGKAPYLYHSVWLLIYLLCFAGHSSQGYCNPLNRQFGSW